MVQDCSDVSPLKPMPVTNVVLENVQLREGLVKGRVCPVEVVHLKS